MKAKFNKYLQEMTTVEIDREITKTLKAAEMPKQLECRDCHKIFKSQDKFTICPECCAGMHKMIDNLGKVMGSTFRKTGNGKWKLTLKF